MEKSIVLAGYKRSPFTFAKKGELALNRPDDMAGLVVKNLIETIGVDPSDIEDLIMGCAFPEGEQGYNVARQVVNQAGLPVSVAGVTVNRFCGSSMQAIHMAAGAIQMGSGDAIIAAGMESMSRIPMGGFNPMPSPFLMETYPQAYISMGETAENLAKKYKIDRQRQDEFAVMSHKKAASAVAAGYFKDEILPIMNAEGRLIDQDGCIRPDSNLEALSALKPAFDQDGSVTAATASPLTDGIVAVMVCTEEYARTNKLEIMARIKSIAVAGCGAEVMGIGPVASSRKALERAGVTLEDIDVIELNEAFAAQSLSVIEELGIDVEKVNIDGGAIALGHPLGASGGRITAKAAQIMKRQGKKLALSTMCIGGGQGISTVLEAVD